MDIKKEVVNKLNEDYGKDLLNLAKCHEIYRNLQQEKQQAESELNLSCRESQIGRKVNDAKENVEKCDIVLAKVKDCVQRIETTLEEEDEITKSVLNHFDKLHLLQSTLQYMKVIQRIEYLNIELQKEVRRKDNEQCATVYANLCEISRNLIDCPVNNLRHYLREVLHHWHNILKEKFSKEYEELVKLIRWPFVNSNISLLIPPQGSLKKLQIMAEYLLQIELPPEVAAQPNVSSNPILTDFTPLCLPVHLLVEPLRKRFLFHFYGARKTNRPDKPEWYLSQILAWIRDHQDFVEKWIQPVIDKLGLHDIDARVELCRGLVQLGIEKLYTDLPTIQYDDLTFSHAVDEALGFEKELRETYCYPPSQASILVVLTQAQVFRKWLNMEKKYALEKMEAILSPTAGSPFELLASDIEDLKITVCADAFITLLQTITYRYESLPQPGHRLQFLDLQLQMLDDFRVRLFQLTQLEQGDIVESRVPMIANSVHYIENVLIDWSTTLHFLDLYYYKSQFEKIEPTNSIYNDLDEILAVDIETESVFTETLSLYGHLRKDLLGMLSEYVVAEAKSKSKSYCYEKWLLMSSQKDFKSLSLTPSACPMFEVLAKRLHQLQKSLAGNLFSMVWKSIARQVDTFLFEDLVLDSRFSEGGALQLKYDVMRNLLPLFGLYTEKPTDYFTQLIESCNLLNISKGSALLLRETLIALEGATGVEDTRGRALKEIGVSNFTPIMAVAILNQRADITVNRLDVD